MQALAELCGGGGESGGRCSTHQRVVSSGGWERCSVSRCTASGCCWRQRMGGSGGIALCCCCCCDAATGASDDVVIRVAAPPAIGWRRSAGLDEAERRAFLAGLPVSDAPHYWTWSAEYSPAPLTMSASSHDITLSIAHGLGGGVRECTSASGGSCLTKSDDVE